MSSWFKNFTFHIYIFFLMKAVFPILFMSVCMCSFYTIQQIWFKRSGETSPYIRLYGFIIFTDIFESWPSHPQAVFISTGLEINNNYRAKGQTKERERKKKRKPSTFDLSLRAKRLTWDMGNTSVTEGNWNINTANTIAKYWWYYWQHYYYSYNTTTITGGDNVASCLHLTN